MSRIETRWRVQYKRSDEHEFKAGVAFYDRETAHNLAKTKGPGLVGRVVREEREVEAVYGAEQPDTPTDEGEA